MAQILRGRAWVAGALGATCGMLLLLGHSWRLQERSVLAAAPVGSAAARTQALLDSDFSHRLLDDTKKVVWQPLRPYHPNYYPEKLYLYTGPETDLYGHGSAITEMKGILRQNHPETYVKTFGDLRTATLRAATWDNAAHVIVFPPFTEYPDLHMVSKTDLRGYASSGNTIVFMGGFGSVAVMNEIFGWSIRPVSYQEGPFYRSKRNAHNTVFDGMPSLLESGREPIYGVHMSTLPPGARSYYDSIGDCVVFAVRYDLGMVAYVASTMEERQGHGKWHQVLRAAVAI